MPRRWPLTTLVVGLVLVAVYFLLRMAGVVGRPTDIGGGGVFVLGTAMALLGAGVSLSDWLDSRR